MYLLLILIINNSTVKTYIQYMCCTVMKFCELSISAAFIINKPHGVL